MDILLVIPRSPELDIKSIDSIHNSSIEMMPLGIFYIATLLQENGYGTAVLDFNTVDDEQQQDNILEDALLKKPGIVGISTSTITYLRGRKIALKIRELVGNNIKIVWGGYHVMFLPDEPLQEGTADIIVRGEGELAMLEIARCILDKRGSIDEIGGISYKVDNQTVHNRPALLRIKDLEQLPYPRRDFVDISKYRNPGTIIASRGCVARCQFCAAGALGSVFMRNPEDIVNEIKYLLSTYDFSHLFFVDNTFTTYKKRTLRILEMLKSDGINMKFSIESRVSQITEEYIKALGEGGVIGIQFGVETGNSGIMNNIRKKITLEQVENAVNTSLEAGIRVMTSFVIGHPDDTKETVMDTINFAKKMRRRGAQVVFGILTPFPGTEIFNKRDKLGIKITSWDFSTWDLGTAVIRTRHLTMKDLKALHTTALSEINAL